MNIQGTEHNQSKEIDVIELVKVLWDKKTWVLLSTFICTAIAGIYAFTAKEQWTSKAEVVAPKLIDLGDYYTVRKEYARILNSEFDASAVAGSLFGRFNLYTESLDKRNDFFSQSHLYKAMVEGQSESDKRKILSDLVNESISIAKPDPKKEPDLIGRRINFSAESAELAQDTLKSFINFNSNVAYQEDIDNFLINFNEVLKDLNHEKASFERDLAIQKSVQLDNLNKALNIAKEAGIVEYLKSFDSTKDLIQNMVLSDTKVPLSDSKLSDGTYLFMLGEKYLQAQIDVLTKSEIVYPPRYYLVSELLKELEPLLERTKKAKAQAFSYQASPDYPVIKDKPKKALILAVGFILGLLLGAIVSLTLYFLKYKENDV